MRCVLYCEVCVLYWVCFAYTPNHTPTILAPSPIPLHQCQQCVGAAAAVCQSQCKKSFSCRPGHFDEGGQQGPCAWGDAVVWSWCWVVPQPQERRGVRACEACGRVWDTQGGCAVDGHYGVVRCDGAQCCVYCCAVMIDDSSASKSW